MTEGIPARSSTAGRTMSLSRLGATSARNMAVMTPIGTPIRIARKVPTMEVSMTNSIPKLGDAAAGCHTVPNKISSSPTLNSAGVPLISIYSVMEQQPIRRKAAGSKDALCSFFDGGLAAMTGSYGKCLRSHAGSLLSLFRLFVNCNQSHGLHYLCAFF